MTDDSPRNGPEQDDPSARLEAILAQHREPAETTDEDDPTANGATGLVAAPEGEPAADDAEQDPLPEAPLFALLGTIENDIGPERVDRIWVFPPRRLQSGETAVVVVAAYSDSQDDRRHVYAAHYTAHEEAKKPRLVLDEYGTAPTDRVGRLVEEVVDRLKEEPAGAPRAYTIEGEEPRWHTALHELADAFLTETSRNPRLRP